MRYSKLWVFGTLNCPTKFPSFSLSCPRAHNNKNCDGRNCRCDAAAGSGAEGWCRMVSGRLSTVTTCTNRVLLMHQLRVMWESSQKFFQDIPGENVVARNMLQNFIKFFNSKFSVSQLQCSTICIPVALVYTDQVSYWAIPVNASLHEFCAVPVHDYTRGLRAEDAQYIAVFVITQGTNSSTHLELIPTHTNNRKWDNVAQCGSIWFNVAQCSWVRNTLIRCEACSDSPFGRRCRISSLAYHYINFNNLSLIPISFVLK